MIIVIMEEYLELMASLYFVQVGILFIISFVLAISGAIEKKKTSAKDYFLTAWWILIIGFTGWVIVIMSGFGW